MFSETTRSGMAADKGAANPAPKVNTMPITHRDTLLSDCMMNFNNLAPDTPFLHDNYRHEGSEMLPVLAADPGRARTTQRQVS